MEDLPDEVLIKQVLPYLDINSLFNFCKVPNSRISRLCSDPYIWAARIENEFHLTGPKPKFISWKDYYFDTLNFYHRVSDPDQKPVDITWQNYFISQFVSKYKLTVPVLIGDIRTLQVNMAIIGRITIIPNSSTLADIITQVRAFSSSKHYTIGFYARGPQPVDNPKRRLFSLTMNHGKVCASKPFAQFSISKLAALKGGVAIFVDFTPSRFMSGAMWGISKLMKCNYEDNMDRTLFPVFPEEIEKLDAGDYPLVYE